MSFKNVDSGEFGLRVNGVDMMIGSDMLKDATVIENVHAPLPSVTLTFLDNKRAAASAGVFVDGAKLEVTIGDGKKEPRVYKMRQWSLTDGAANTAGDLCTISGTADLVPWFRKVVDKPYKGHATEAVTQMAKDAGITRVDADTSNDKMTWHPDGSTISQLARRIIDHSWLAEGKSLFMALTTDGGEPLLRIKDIMTKGDSADKPLASAGMSDPDHYTVWDYRIASHSGFLNAITNYGHKVVQEKLSGAPDVFSTLDITKLASSLGINSQLMQAVGLVRTLYHAPDVGNTHSNYVKASHHNVKSRATFSSVVHFLLDELTNYKLLDDLQATLARSSGQVDPAFSGGYKITAIARHLSKGSYREKVVGSSQGTNADQFNQGA